jgi:hypothetical protein
MGLAIHHTKDKVTDLKARSLEMGATLCSCPEPADHLSHNSRLGNINRQVPKNGLGGQRHFHPKRGQPHGHLSVLDYRKAHILV